MHSQKLHEIYGGTDPQEFDFYFSLHRVASEVPGTKTLRKICLGHTKPLIIHKQLGVSKNRGTPNWMVYGGKPY